MYKMESGSFNVLEREFIEWEQMINLFEEMVLPKKLSPHSIIWRSFEKLKRLFCKFAEYALMKWIVFSSTF